MVANRPFLYFYDNAANGAGKYVIHVIECSELLHDREYIGIAPSPLLALHRAEGIFSEKPFVLCPKCCRETEFEP